MTSVPRWWLVAVLGYFGLATGWGQEGRATLGGRVTDPRGGVVPGASVTVTSDDTQVKQTTASNDQGNWLVQYLIPGNYSFTVAAQGFKTSERHGMTLQVGDIKQMDIALELGAVTEKIVVTGEAPLIDTSSAVSGSVINEVEIDQLPSMTHVVTLFAGLAPGIQPLDQNQNVVRLWSSRGDEEISVGKKWTPQLRHGGRIPNRGADGHRKSADRKGGGPRLLFAE